MDLTTVASDFFVAESRGDTALVTLTRERLTEDDNLEQFSYDLSNLIEKGSVRKLILDCGELEYMTSSAIGRLISVHRRLGRERGMIVLCNLTSGVRDILDTARLLTYFHSAIEVTAALAMTNTPAGTQSIIA